MGICETAYNIQNKTKESIENNKIKKPLYFTTNKRKKI